MNSCLSDVRTFLNNERKTLEYLSSKISRKGLQEIANAANQSRYTNFNKGLSVYLPWSVPLVTYDDIGRIHVGGVVCCQNGAIDNISYFLAVTRKNSSDGRHRVLRKYHFDYCNPGNSRRTPHPLFHLQMPGKLPPHMPRENYDVSQLNPELSEPRILYLPMSLSLVLHVAFSEFASDDTDNIRKDGRWRNLIKRDQEALWKPYMEKCLEHIDHGRVIFDEAYAT